MKLESVFKRVVLPRTGASRNDDVEPRLIAPSMSMSISGVNALNSEEVVLADRTGAETSGSSPPPPSSARGE